MFDKENKICQECGETFKNQRGLHCHFKKHDLSVAEYYLKHYPRHDLYDRKLIKFKSLEQYLTDEFNSKSNMRKWLDGFDPEDPVIQSFLEEKLVDHLKQKGSEYAPCELYLDTGKLPTKEYYDKSFGSYDMFVKSIGLKNNFGGQLPKDFWKPLKKEPEIFIDTREQKPLRFKNFKQHKLDFGDYTASGKFYSKTYIERKSAADFVSTLTSGLDRFEKEVKRCQQFNSFLFVLIESLPDKIYGSVCRHVKPNMDYLWHNVRKILLDYPESVQFVFGGNRAGVKYLIPRILYYGEDLWRIDLDRELKKKIKQKESCLGK